MLRHDAADDPRASEESNILDQIEPIETTNDYREASLKFICFIHSALNFIHEASSPKEQAIRLWAVSCAVQNPAIGGKNHSDIARFLCTTRANFSNHVVSFEKQNRLPPTLSQKSVQARISYSTARKKQLIK